MRSDASSGVAGVYEEAVVWEVREEKPGLSCEVEAERTTESRQSSHVHRHCEWEPRALPLILCARLGDAVIFGLYIVCVSTALSISVPTVHCCSRTTGLGQVTSPFCWLSHHSNEKHIMYPQAPGSVPGIRRDNW